jgi:hypothetical protein
MDYAKTLRVAAALGLLAALGACDTVKGVANMVSNGVSGNAPDQPMGDDLVRRPPLTLPPDYNLRPPSSTAATATDFTASQQARQTVFGLDSDNKKPAAAIPQKAGRSPGEAALLEHAGASAASPAIRTKVDRETETLKKDEQAFTNTLLKGEPEGQKKADSGFLGGIFSNSDKPSIERKSDGLF